MKFQYRRRPPFRTLLRLLKYELENIDRFLDLARDARQSREQALERIVPKAGGCTPDDWLVDDFVQLDDFALLAAEFAVVGLWRSVELYRKRVIRVTSGKAAASKAFRQKDFQKELLKLGIVEQRIRCARSVDELRCLNNSTKHNRMVDGELADFPRWRSKEGHDLGDLEPHYRRLRPFAERYLADLADRLDRRTAGKVADAGSSRPRSPQRNPNIASWNQNGPKQTRPRSQAPALQR